MKIVYFIIFVSFAFSINKYLDTNIYYNIDKSGISSDETIPLKYPLYSAIVPGLGQYKLYKETSISNHKIRAFSFFGIEVLSWAINLEYRKQYNDQKDSYKEYADQNWDFENWIISYHDFEYTEYQDAWMGPDAYTEIGQSSHFVQFWIDGELMRTTDGEFEEYYYDWIDMDSSISIYDLHEINIIKDQHFYENIGKYNEFFSGWADADLENIIIDTTSHNYTIALSPKKNNYIDSYEKAEHFSDISENALTCIYFNHFISMLDAFILARKFGGKVMLNSSTVYDKKQPLNPIGVRVNLIIKL